MRFKDVLPKCSEVVAAISAELTARSVPHTVEELCIWVGEDHVRIEVSPEIGGLSRYRKEPTGKVLVRVPGAWSRSGTLLAAKTLRTRKGGTVNIKAVCDHVEKVIELNASVKANRIAEQISTDDNESRCTAIVAKHPQLKTHLCADKHGIQFKLRNATDEQLAKLAEVVS